MEKIFQDAKDKYVTAVIVFGEDEEHKLYVDADLTEQVSADVCKDAFEKGVLMVVVDDAEYRPIKFEGNKVTVAGVVNAAIKGTEYTAKA